MGKFLHKVRGVFTSVVYYRIGLVLSVIFFVGIAVLGDADEPFISWIYAAGSAMDANDPVAYGLFSIYMALSAIFQVLSCVIHLIMLRCNRKKDT